MKPKAKKTIIWIVAIAIVAAIIYFAVRRNKTDVDRVIDKLDVNAATKEILREAVANLTANPNFKKEQYEADAKDMGLTYAQFLVQCAAAMPGVSNRIPTLEYEIIMRQM